TAIFHNPQRTDNWFPWHEIQHALNSGFYGDMRLITQSKYDDARKVGRWIGEDIGEIQVQGNESAILAATNIDNRSSDAPPRDRRSAHRVQRWQTPSAMTARGFRQV